MSDCGPAETLPVRQTRRKVLPVVEGLTLAVAILLPLVLQDYLTVFATRVIILSLFALSF
ncbi:MAG TPA: branched-chain amino acid ABC transporter permease, partial [Bradyrhizobium sp.]|nr:branched-chain amino acid ABC transporter permease [Bradyrhizobium sp.]